MALLDKFSHVWHDEIYPKAPKQEAGLPVLAYVGADSLGGESLRLPPVFPTRLVSYQDDMTYVTLTLPDQMAKPHLMPSYNQEVRMRFKVGNGLPSADISGVVCSITFNRDEARRIYQAEITAMLSGKGSSAEISKLTDWIISSKSASSASRSYEYVKEARDKMGSVIAIAHGPAILELEPADNVAQFLRDQSGSYRHELGPEIRKYFAAQTDAVLALRQVIGSFGVDSILDRMSEVILETEEAAILRREQERIDAVALSLRRKRVILVRPPSPEP